MAGVGVCEGAVHGVENGVDEGDEPVRPQARRDGAGQAGAQRARERIAGHQVLEARLRAGHEEGGGGALAAHVGDGYGQAAAGEGGQVVEVAAQAFRGPPGHGQVEARHARGRAHEEAALHLARVRLQAVGAASSSAHRDLRAHGVEQAGVVPRLLHEVAHALAHRRHGQGHGRPRGHHHHRQVRIDRAHARDQLQPLVAGGRVARVVEVHQQQVVRVLGLAQRGQHRRGRGDRAHREAVALEEQAERFEDVGLVVGHEDARRLRFGEGPAHEAARRGGVHGGG